MKDIPEEDLELKLYGRADVDPVYANRLLRRIEKDGRISYAGAFTPQQKGEIYGDIDILVVPSLVDESFSIVARDALARGIPVIASDAGALSEIIEYGVNGFLFRPGDHLSLAKYLRDFARNPVALQQLQAPGSLNIISIQEHVRHLLAIYERILGK